MIIDLHNHTALCNHAEGTIEEYIEKAIEQNVAVFGFSDHAPMHFDPKYRMRFDEMSIYETMVGKAKEMFAGTIDIRLAYEVDWLPGYMDDRVLNADVDYLIGSVHFIDGWGFDNPEFIGRYEHEDIDHIWQSYFDLIEAMAKSRLFDIAGHLDLIKVFKFMPTRPIETFAEKALRAIREADMTLELNVAGYRKPVGEPYPSKALLAMAHSLDIPITSGSDAHTPGQVGLFRDEIEALARDVGYTQCAVYEKRERAMVTF